MFVSHYTRVICCHRPSALGPDGQVLSACAKAQEWAAAFQVLETEDAPWRAGPGIKPWGSSGKLTYPLVNKRSELENGHEHSGFSHRKWWFSIAMLNYQRVTVENHHCKMGKLTISMASFNSYVTNYQRVVGIQWDTMGYNGIQKRPNGAQQAPEISPVAVFDYWRATHQDWGCWCLMGQKMAFSIRW